MDHVDPPSSSDGSPAAAPDDGAPWRRILTPRTPSQRRGPFARWPRAADAVLAVAVFVASTIAVAANSLPDGVAFTLNAVGDLPAAAYVLLAVSSAALVWRRRSPIAVVVVTFASAVVWSFLEYAEGQDLALLIAMYSVGRYCLDHRYSLATVVVAVGIVGAGSASDADSAVDVAAAMALTWLAWYVGRRLLNRGSYLALLQDRARQLEREQEARAREAVAAERTRIARELHDIVAHRVSMMTVQAGAARTIARQDVDTAVEAMSDIEHAGRQALGELRHLLGVLRTDAPDPEDLLPQPGLAQLHHLTDQLEHTGASVCVVVDPRSGDLPAAIDLSGYRIAQESLTNVVKHAGPNPTVDVSVTVDGSRLLIDITNTTSVDLSTTLPPSGYGLTGMAERAALLGGSLTAGPTGEGRWRVSAEIPLEAAAT